MKKQLNEQISRIKDMMKKINEDSFHDETPNIGEPSSVMDDDDDERRERNYGIDDNDRNESGEKLYDEILGASGLNPAYVKFLKDGKKYFFELTVQVNFHGIDGEPAIEEIIIVNGDIMPSVDVDGDDVDSGDEDRKLTEEEIEILNNDQDIIDVIMDNVDDDDFNYAEKEWKNNLPGKDW